ncbi:MAG: class I SAM-dependent methyltransferase [Nitrososphaerota archaeon]
MGKKQHPQPSASPSGQVISTLPEYWDWVAEHSFHLRQSQPAVTDIYYRKLVITLISQLGSGGWRRILKLDAYNEATQTQYGFQFIKNAADLILVDISYGIAKRASQKASSKRLSSNVHIVVADFRRIPLRSASIDMSCSFGSIEHVSEYCEAFYEQARVVRDGGEVFVGVPNLLNFSLRALSMKILYMLGFMQQMTNPEKHFLKPQLRSLAKSLKLSNIVLSGYHLFPKQLRWLDLWIESRGRDTIRRSKVFLWLLKVFTLIELKYPFTRNFAEMIIVRCVKEWGQGREPQSLPSVEVGIIQRRQSI